MPLGKSLIDNGKKRTTHLPNSKSLHEQFLKKQNKRYQD